MNDYQTTIDRIRMVLNVSESSPLDDLRALADEYAAACLDVNGRLSECAKFLRVGNLAEALRLAETPPRVLDLCNLLDFPERSDWEDVCQTYRLTRATVPSAATLEQLNRAFEELASIDELLRRHRFLALARAPLGERLDVLYELAERDVANMIWADSIPALEKALDLEIENDFQRIERDAESTANWKRARELYRRLTDARRATRAPSALSERVKNYLDAASRRAFSDRFQAFENAARSALAAGDVAAKKQALADWNGVATAARGAGATAPRSSLDAKNRLEAALRENEARVLRARRFQTNVGRWAQEIAASADESALEEIWAKIEIAANGGEIPFELSALRDERTAAFRAAAKRRRTRVVALAIGGVVLFFAAAFGIAKLLI